MASSERSDWVKWCIPAGRISDVLVVIHWTFPVFVVLLTIRAASDGGGEWALITLAALLLFYGTILAHEFGHVFAARREGVPAERVVLWPLGGLAQLGESLMGRSEVRIAAAGPAVSLGIAILLLPVLAAAGIPIDLALFDPLHWTWFGREAAFVPDVLYVLYKTNLVAILFNLIPAFPMDGGRILRGLLYPRYGMTRSVLLTTSVSFVLVGLMIVWAFLAGSFTLALVAAYVGFSAWQVRRQVRGSGADGGQPGEIPGYDFSMGHTSLQSGEDRAARALRKKDLLERKRRRRQAREEREIEEQVDRLLEKISAGGLDSLSRHERAFLEQASRRKR
jgi:stage IV sporulation protein FB